MNTNELGMDIDKIADELTQEMESEIKVDPLLPPHAQKERLKSEISDALNDHFLKLANGIRFLLQHIQQMVEVDEPIVQKKVFESLLTKLSENKSDQLTDDELTALYAGAVDLYNSMEYEQAASAFYVLTELDPGQPIFWKCLGNARFFADLFKDAVQAYARALNLNPQDIESAVYQAHCLDKEGRKQEAIEQLTRAKEILESDPKLDEWRVAVTELLHVITNK